MSEDQQVIGLEREGWEALSTSGEAARAYYDRVLDERVLMLLPGGVLMDDRSMVLDSMSGQPWARHQLADVVTMRPLDDVLLVAYTATASREGASEYQAQISSTYVRRSDGWKLVLHQQTPR